MSAIAAVVDWASSAADEASLEVLLQRLAWRGPDQSGAWRGDHVALGANALWTTAEDWGSQQPAVSADGTRALVLDGRVDNRRDLGSVLRAEGLDPDSCSDAELALAAYSRWGKGFVEQLAGPFSVAVWDARQRTLVCARDPLGQRPLFYRATGKRLLVASSIAALRAVPGTTNTLNDDYLWDYLCSGGIVGSFDPEITPFVEIARVPAGHTLVATLDGARVERYWEPWTLAPLAYRDDREVAEHFDAVFTEVVRALPHAAGPARPR